MTSKNKDLENTIQEKEKQLRKDLENIIQEKEKQLKLNKIVFVILLVSNLGLLIVNLINL